MLWKRYQLKHYTLTGPKASFVFKEQTLDHLSVLAVIKGHVHYRIGDEEGEAHFGNLLLAPKGIPFHREALSEVTYFHIHLKETNTEQSGEDTWMEPLAGKIKIHDLSRLSSTYHYLAEAKTAQNHEQHLSEHMVSDLLVLIELEASRVKANHVPEDPLMETAARLIREYGFSAITIKQVARQLGIHPAHLSRRFQQVHGLGPLAWLTRIRLDEAKKLLLETHDTLESIALRCGFESGSYFSRIFKQHVGVSPSEYRRSYRT